MPVDSSRAVCGRFGKHLETAVPLIVGHMESAKEGQEELMECCLHALEGFVLRCPLDVQGFIDCIVDTALQYIGHDPNFADDFGEDMEEDDMEEEEDDEYVQFGWWMWRK